MEQKKPIHPKATWILYSIAVATQPRTTTLCFVLDVETDFCFHRHISQDILTKEEIQKALNTAYDIAETWPEQLWISNEDPLLVTRDTWAADLDFPMMTLTEIALQPWVGGFIAGFGKYIRPRPLAEAPKKNEHV
jgi:hypothetical protein